MTKKNKIKKNMIITVIILSMLLLTLHLTGFLSILGEEEYEIYDPLMLTNSYDNTKFSLTQSNIFTDGISNSETGIIGDAKYCTGVNCLFNGYSTIKIDDLRLKNIKLDVKLFESKCSNIYNQKIFTYSYFVTSKGTKIESSENYNDLSFNSNEINNVVKSGSLELLWLDNENGYYELKWQGLIIESGTINKDEDYYIIFYTNRKTQDSGSYSGLVCESKIELKNIRSKEFFSCDPKDGEYIVSRQFISGQDFNINNLRGFKRFCLNIPVQHLKDGVLASKISTYYDLVKGETIMVNDNEIYRVFYIGDGESLGVTQLCESGLWDVNNNQCGELTGFVDICPTSSYFDGQKCVTGIINNIDYDYAELIAPETIKLVFNPTKTIYKNGQFDFINGKTIFEGYNTNDQQLFNYPLPKKEFYKFEFNDEEYYPENNYYINEFISLYFQKAEATVKFAINGANNITYLNKITVEECEGKEPIQVIVNDGTNDYEQIVYIDLTSCTEKVKELLETITIYGDEGILIDWQNTVNINVEKPFIKINDLISDKIIDISDTESTISVSLTNNYLKSVDLIIGVVYEESIGRSFSFTPITINKGDNIVNIPIRKNNLGGVNAYIVALFPVGQKALQVSDTKMISYYVVDKELNDTLNSEEEIALLNYQINSLNLTNQEQKDYIESLNLNDEQTIILNKYNTNYKNNKYLVFGVIISSLIMIFLIYKKLYKK